MKKGDTRRVRSDDTPPIFKNIDDAHQALQSIMKDNPDLSISGFDTRFTKPEVFEEQRAALALPTFTIGFWLACDFLQRYQRLSRVNKAQSSYGLKHNIERYFNFYIANGACIAALIHCGFTIQWQRDEESVFGNFRAACVPYHHAMPQQIASSVPTEAVSSCRASWQLAPTYGLHADWEEFKAALSSNGGQKE